MPTPSIKIYPPPELENTDRNKWIRGILVKCVTVGNRDGGKITGFLGLSDRGIYSHMWSIDKISATKT
jgi:hypothetical protein